MYLFYCSFFVLLLVISFLFLFNHWMFTCLQQACFFVAFLILASVSFCDIDTGNKNYEISLITYLRHLKLIYLNIVLDSGYKKKIFT